MIAGVGVREQKKGYGSKLYEETIKAELMVQMQAEFDRKLAEAVAKTKAELSGPADGADADADADKAGGKKGK